MGRKLLAKYVITAELRSANPGVRAFRAVQTGLDREVELRILIRPEALTAQEFDRFRTDFQGLARLDHPNIASLLDMGYTETKIYYTTEFRNAICLEDLLLRIDGPMKPAEVVEVARAIGSALAHLHENQILHKSLSTSTVYYDLDNKRPYLAQLSLMQDLESSCSHSTSSQMPRTSVLTPEGLTDAPYNAVTDLFLLGTLLYRLATFKPPLPEDVNPRDLTVEDFANIDRPSIHNPQVPPWMDGLIMRLLAPAPSERFQSADDLLEALGDHVRPASADEPSAIIIDRRQLIEDLSETLAVEALPTKSQELLLPLPVVVLAVAVFMSLFAFAALRHSGPRPIRGPGGKRTLHQGAATAIEREVVLVCNNLTDNPVKQSNFMSNWSLLQAYVLSLPEQQQREVLSYPKLLTLKRQFYADPPGACQSLEAALRTCSKAILPEK